MGGWRSVGGVPVGHQLVEELQGLGRFWAAGKLQAPTRKLPWSAKPLPHEFLWIPRAAEKAKASQLIMDTK